MEPTIPPAAALPPVIKADRPSLVVRAARGARRIKLLLASAALGAVSLYDVASAGGIDFNGLLRPLLGDTVDVGRLLSTVALVMVILRFSTQTRMFRSSNRNGLDNPDAPEGA